MKKLLLRALISFCLAYTVVSISYAMILKYQNADHSQKAYTCTKIINDLMNQLHLQYEENDRLNRTIEVMVEEFEKWYVENNRMQEKQNADIICSDPECIID